MSGSRPDAIAGSDRHTATKAEGIATAERLAVPQHSFLRAQTDRRQLRWLIFSFAFGLVQFMIHSTSPVVVSAPRNFRIPLPTSSNCSESARSAAAPPNSPHRFLCSQSVEPIPREPRARCRRCRTHTLRAPELQLRSLPPADVRPDKETPPDFHGLRSPVHRSPDTSRTATGCGTARTSSPASACVFRNCRSDSSQTRLTPSVTDAKSLLLRDHANAHFSVGVNRESTHASAAEINGVDLRQVGRALQVALSPVCDTRSLPLERSCPAQQPLPA